MPGGAKPDARAAMRDRPSPGDRASRGDRPSHRAGARLEVDLLGPVRLRWHGEVIPSGGRNADALITLLALRGGLRAREEVSTALWPDGGTASLAWLRQAIWRLRRALGVIADEVLVAGQDRVGLAPGLDTAVDVTTFEAALRAKPPRLAEAVTLYRGDLAEGSDLECFVRERERLADLYEDALGRLAKGCLARGDLDGARSAAVRLVARDPLREDAHALLISVYGLEGERSQVVRQYRRVRRLLEDELGVAPLPETELAYAAALEESTRRSGQRAKTLLARGGDAATVWAPDAASRAAASRDARKTPA